MISNWKKKKKRNIIKFYDFPLKAVVVSGPDRQMAIERCIAALRCAAVLSWSPSLAQPAGAKSRK